MSRAGSGGGWNGLGLKFDGLVAEVCFDVLQFGQKALRAVAAPAEATRRSGDAVRVSRGLRGWCGACEELRGVPDAIGR